MSRRRNWQQDTKRERGQQQSQNQEEDVGIRQVIPPGGGLFAYVLKERLPQREEEKELGTRDRRFTQVRSPARNQNKWCVLPTRRCRSTRQSRPSTCWPDSCVLVVLSIKVAVRGAHPAPEHSPIMHQHQTRNNAQTYSLKDVACNASQRRKSQVFLRSPARSSVRKHTGVAVRQVAPCLPRSAIGN